MVGQALMPEQTMVTTAAIQINASSTAAEEIKKSAHLQRETLSVNM